MFYFQFHDFLTDPCPGNFTRVARNCYHFSERQFNWKSAMSMCKSLGGNLLELESKEEYTEFITFLLADKQTRGKYLSTS